MSTAMTVVGSLAMVAFGGWLVARMSGSWLPRRPTFIWVAYAALVVTHYVPSLLFLGDPEFPHAERFHLALSASLLLMALGAGYAHRMLRLSPRQIFDFYRRCGDAPVTRNDITFVVGYGAACVALFAIYLVEVPSWPLLSLLMGGDTASANEARRSVLGPGLGSPISYLYGLARTALFPICMALIAAVFWRVPRPRTRYYLAGCGVVIFLFNSWSGAKTPVAMLFVIIALVLIIPHGLHPSAVLKRVRRRRPSGRRRLLDGVRIEYVVALVLAIAVAYPVFVFAHKTFGQTSTLGEVLRVGIVDRIVGTPAFLSYYQLEIFPALHPHTWFSDIRLLTAVTGQEFVNLSLLTGSIARGTVTHAPPAALGNLYSQGGLWLMLVGACLTGALLQAMQATVIRRLPASPLTVAFIAYLCWAAFRLSMTGVHTVIMSEGLVPVALLALVWLSYRKTTRQHQPAAVT